ncbi:patatin-like phospholipase family protein [Dyella jiangningensis]|uniref:patatin-like phospholipase family protein n=1 Tax=Dyella jiangningensis TaxID=1379159 RepID=UPI00240FCF3D|nr:patatin-like phospholipase family protein [Dyella jiangningensis]MDG2537078.1 patatin-like phospholipase family protein [Dyella jiangningensis]
MRLRLALIASLLLCTSLSVSAQASSAATTSPCIGVVLGGGGARGAAHIGVLEVLEREHIPVCRVAGTSMGSIVGGLYAAGYTPAEMHSIITSLDWNDLFSDDPARMEMPMRRKDADYRYLLNFEVGYKNGHIITPAGVVQGQKLLLLLRRLLISTWDVHNFDNLSIPFRAVATDIVAGKPVVFGSGDLALAIRSSMSVPGAFAPTNVDDQLLVDGGLMDNVPIDVMRSMGAQKLIVVDVGSPLLKREQLSNPVAVLNQMVSALMDEKTQRQLNTLGPDDILIKPELGDMSASEFNRGEEAIAIGRAAAEAALPRLRQLAVGPAQWQQFVDGHRQRQFDPALVSFLKVDAAHTDTAKYVEERLEKDVGKPFDPTKLEEQIGSIYGRGNYQQIDYHLQKDGEQQGLLIVPRDKPWGPIYGKVGFQLDDDFQGRSEYLISGEINATNINRYGGEWRSTLWAGRIGGLASEFYQPFGQGATAYIMPSLLLRNEDFPLFDDNGDKQLAEYRIKRRSFGLEAGWSPTSTWRFLTSVDRGKDSGDLRIGSPVEFPPSQASNYSVVRVGTDWDSLDNAQFPSRGAHINLYYDMYRPFMGGRVTDDVARLVADWVPDLWPTDGRYRLLLGVRASSSLDNKPYFESQGFLGGFLNLSGYSERSLYGNQTALARAVLYRRTGKMDAIFSTPVYIGASLEAGNTWHDKSDVRLDSLIYAGSMFLGIQTPLGPLFLGYGYAQGGHNSVYLTFGSLLRPQL